jgi:hypothetical protein
MLGHNIHSLAVVLAVSCVLLAPGCALAYVGPGPGVDNIPVFYGLLIVVGLALAAVLVWPISAVIRRLLRGKQ